MRWLVGGPLVLVSLFASALAFAETTMATPHAPGFLKPILPAPKTHAPPPAPPPKPAIILKAPAPPPPAKPLAATIVLKTDASKATPVVPGRADARVLAAGTIVLHRRDVPKGPLFAVAITAPKKP